MIEIINGIFIAPIDESYDQNVYERYNIKVIFNCTTTYAFINDNKITKIRIPLSYEMNNMDILSLKNSIDKIVTIMKNNFINKNIVIFCYNGKTISPLIVALFIYKITKIDPHIIIESMRTKIQDLSIDYDLTKF